MRGSAVFTTNLYMLKITFEMDEVIAPWPNMVFA